MVCPEPVFILDSIKTGDQSKLDGTRVLNSGRIAFYTEINYPRILRVLNENENI